MNVSNLGGSTALIIDDSEDSNYTGSLVIGSSQATVAIDSLTPAIFNYSNLGALTIEASSFGDNTISVDGTPAGTSASPVITTILSYGPGDTVDVQGTTQYGPLTVDVQSQNGVEVMVGSAGLLQEIQGQILVENINDTGSLTIDDSAASIAQSALLEFDPTIGYSDLTGLSPATIAFNPSDVSEVILSSGNAPSVSYNLTVDFSQGNPLPIGTSSGFSYQGNLGSNNTLVLQGELPDATKFDSETYTPTPDDAGAGSITLTYLATSTLKFSGLTPIIDTVPVTNYTFTAPSSAQLVNVTDGPIVNTYQTIQISSGDIPSAFELVDFANKTNVMADLSQIADPMYIQPPTAPATGLVSLTLDYFQAQTNDKTITVNGTTSGVANTIMINGSGNTVDVENASPDGPLTITSIPGSPGLTNTVDIGNDGDLSQIQSNITITGAPGSTNVSIDGSSNWNVFGDMLLEMNASQPMADLTGVLPGATLSYDPNAINSFELSTGSGTNSLLVDFVNGNPFFGQDPGAVPYYLTFNGGSGFGSLGLQDSAASPTPIFNSEDYNSTGANSGDVAFYDSNSPSPADFQGGVEFLNLTPITDSTPVLNYTFTAPISGGTIAVTDDATAGWTLIDDPSSSPSFESVAYTNKTNVTIDASGATGNEVFILNNPTAAMGQQSLTADLGGASNTVEVVANPAGIPTTIDGGLGSDLFTVVGTGLASGTTPGNFEIQGGTGINTLRVNAPGTTPSLSPSTSSLPADVTFAYGAASTGFAFTNMSAIELYESNNAPVLTTPPLAISAQTGVTLSDVTVGSFTDADLLEDVGSYQATIDWGDGSLPTAGTIISDPTTPGLYYVSGNHTYSAAGDYSISVTVADLGATVNSTLVNDGGIVVPVTTQLDAIASVHGTTADVTVASIPVPPAADLELVSTSPIDATAGTAETGVLAIFSDANGPTLAGDFFAQINWGDGTGLAGGVIAVDDSTPGDFTITGTHVFAAPGTYTGTIELTSTAGQSLSIPLTATVTGLDLTPGLPTEGPFATAGTATGTLSVATADAVGMAPAPVLGGFSAVVNWGDGSTPVTAMIAADGSSLTIGTSGHTYASPGDYTVSITVYDSAYAVVGQSDYSVSVQAPTVQAATGLTADSDVPTGEWTVATVSVPFYQGAPGLDYQNYTASIDFGDGSPAVPATLSPTSENGATAFTVATSGHTYAAPGSYTLLVTIRDGAGVIVGTDSVSVIASEPPPILSGRLSPQSDSGMSDSDGITNVTTPTFVGNATPGATIQVYATPTGSSATPVLIATGVASQAGTWSATVVNAAMADGSYQITAEATDLGGSSSASLGTVVIDTVAPVITNVVFRRRRDVMEVYFQGSLSGLDLTDLSNGANYQLSARPLNKHIPVRHVIISTSITLIAGGAGTDTEEAIVVFNHGKPLRGGHYTLRVLATGITDLAGNELDGTFYGSMPSGNGGSGGNFVAQITAMPRRVLGPFPIKTGYAKPVTSVASARKAHPAMHVHTLARPRVINVLKAGAAGPRSDPSAAHLLDEAIASLAGVKPDRRGQ